jgi:hypothetical protein
VTIGMTFPVLNPKEGEPTSVPWGMVEPHRSRAMQNHFQPLERLYARGGLSIGELARLITDKEGNAELSDEYALKIVRAHIGQGGDDAKKA